MHTNVQHVVELFIMKVMNTVLFSAVSLHQQQGENFMAGNILDNQIG